MSLKKLYSNSIIEKEYISHLKNNEIKIVSFDIFNTLAFRDVAKPEDIFRKIAKTKYVRNIFNDKNAFFNYRISAEKKARLHKQTSEEITLKEIYKYIPISEQEKNKIAKLEIQYETKSIYINKQLERWMELAKQHNKKVILISDMYLSKKQIHKIVLSKLKNPNLIDNLFVSSQEKVTKTTGNLYMKIKHLMKFDFSQQIHIGDNSNSDIKVARELGIHTLFYNLNSNNQEVVNIESHHLKKQLPKSNNLRILSTLLNPYSRKTEKFFFDLGSMIYGPILWEFSHWIYKIYKNNNITQVNFIMREGRIFKKCLELIDKDINVNLIYASRSSTYLASIDIDEFEEKGIDFYKFKMFTIGDFYDKFHIPIKNQKIKKYEHYLCTDAEKISIKEKNILELVSEDFFSQIDTIKQNILEAKNIISRYLKQLKIHKNSITLDFGGGGTILKRLDNMYPDFSNTFGLFYIHSSGYTNLPTKMQFSFFQATSQSAHDIELIRRTPEMTEILFNGATYTTSGYEYKNNLISPVVEKIKLNNKNIYNAFDSGIESFFSIAKTYKTKDNLFKIDELIKILSRLIEIPTKEEVDFIGNLNFDVGGGSSQLVKIIDNKYSFEKNAVDEIYQKASSNIDIHKDTIPWINGIITKHDPDFIKRQKAYLDISSNNQAITSLVTQLKSLKLTRTYVYGAGDFFIALLPHFDTLGINITSLIDVRASNMEFTLEGYKVKTIYNTNLQDNDTIIVASAAYVTQIVKNIKKVTKNLNNVKIIHI